MSLLSIYNTLKKEGAAPPPGHGMSSLCHVMEEGPGREHVPPSTTEQGPAEDNAAQTVGQADPSHQARWQRVLWRRRDAAVLSLAKA